MKANFILAIGLMMGCASKPVVYYQVPVDNKATVAQPPRNVDGLRFQENVKAYPLGRYSDSHNPRIMHERHLAYRIEQDSTWDYSPNQSFIVPLGKAAVSQPNSVSSFKSALSEVEIKKQQDRNGLLLEQNKMLSQKLDKIEKENKQIAQLAKENQKLQEELIQIGVETHNLRKNLETKSQAQTVVEQPKKKGLFEKLTGLLPN